jgi:hypothetical protein
MSRRGDCWDNACAESWFGLMKREMLYLLDEDDFNKIKSAVFEYIEVFYNRQRSHSTINYMTPEEFINKAFADSPPKPSVIWLAGDIKGNVSKILGHSYHKLRVKYWEKDQKTTWVLDEIGKEKFITTGIVINAQNEIEEVKVLTFRETRGWEVKHSFFTDQFKQVAIKPDSQLSKNIDGITGATLSVHALKVQARMALYLHENRKTKEK